MKQDMMKIYYKRMQEAKNMLGDKCVVCGTTEDLEFDHIDPTTKLFTIAHGYARKTFYEEVKKCQLLCKKHHILKTKTQGDVPQTVSINEGIHGTGYTYIQKKCRCALCRTWRRKNRRKEVSYSDMVDKPDEGIQLRNFDSIVHGTYAGYKKECRLKITKCDDCKAANREYMKNLNDKKQ